MSLKAGQGSTSTLSDQNAGTTTKQNSTDTQQSGSDDSTSANGPDYVPCVGDVVEIIGTDEKLGKSFKGIVFIDADGDKLIAMHAGWDYFSKYTRFPITKIGETDILAGEPNCDDAVELAKAYFAKAPEFTGSYEERQKQWVEYHGLKVGSKVRVVRKAHDYEGGYEHPYSKGKDKLIGNAFEITTIHSDSINFNGWCWPYMVLEPVKQ